MHKNLSKKQIIVAWYIIFSVLLVWLLWLLQTQRMDGMDILVGFWIIPVAWLGLSIHICGFYVNKLLLKNAFWKRHDIFAKFITVAITLFVVLVACFFLFQF